ncbi:MAG TPA: type III PLP-dependent enzyme [Chloroflexota bacterium]|nr:type III PLP-dependent enzyme [Chloroflexota bacterium]
MNLNHINYPTPFLLVDLDKARQKYRMLRAALPDADIFYAMKPNPESRIIAALLDEGCGVEVASQAELCQVLSLGARPSQIITSNPVKAPSFLHALHTHGVNCMAFDAPVEVDKIAHYAPGSHVYLRLKTDNTGSEWSLSDKFGVDAAEAPDLLHYAADKGLHPFGLTFHVGSQCVNPQNWATALQTCAQVIEQVASEIPIEVINLGGGLPVPYGRPIPTLHEITDIINEARYRLFHNQIRYQIEPGRFLVGDTAVLAASVIGKARRSTADWLYLDVGIYNGLFDTIEQFAYQLDFDVEPGRPQTHFTIAGPSCDSMDKLFTNHPIPDLQVGERLYVRNAGAYTTAIAGHFNGFPPPAVIYTDDFSLHTDEQKEGQLFPKVELLKTV